MKPLLPSSMPNHLAPTIPAIPAFEVGQLVATPAALEVLNQSAVSALDIIRRHASGDWGDLDACDARANADALKSGARLMSAYTVVIEGTAHKIWAITDAVGDDGHRASTCVLLPGDY